MKYYLTDLVVKTITTTPVYKKTKDHLASGSVQTLNGLRIVSV